MRLLENAAAGTIGKWFRIRPIGRDNVGVRAFGDICGATVQLQFAHSPNPNNPAVTTPHTYDAAGSWQSYTSVSAALGTLAPSYSNAGTPSTAQFTVSDANCAAGLSFFSIVLATVNGGAAILIDVRDAKTGSRLAEIIQAGLRAADGPASAITATWGANTLTLTDVGLTRDWSAGNLYDAVGLAPKMGYVIGLNSCWMRGVVVGGNTNGTTKVSLDIMP